MKVLILDDHQIIYQALSELILIIDENISVFHCADVITAIDSIKNNRPNFVITDIQIGDSKQLAVMRLCHKLKIPFMVYTGFVNGYIVNECDSLNCNSYISKSSSTTELRLGIESLFKKSVYRCSIVKKYMNRSPSIVDYTPELNFTKNEEDIILGMINGESTEEIAKRLGKSVYTIRNQRINLMHKNNCSIEVVLKRYIYWNRCN